MPDEDANAHPLPLYWDSAQHAWAAYSPRGEGGGGGSVFHYFLIFLGFLCAFGYLLSSGFFAAIRAGD
jgi:hypothetical protein